MQHVVEKYNQLGIACLPVKKDKTPLLPERWNEGFPPESFSGAYGVGIICGKISGGLECLDFDNHQGDAKERLQQYRAECIDLFNKYDFVIVKTGGGGYHVLYRCEEIGGNQKLARIGVNGKPDVVIETRGENGYIVADPTPGYKIIRGEIEKIPVITPEERSLLLGIARSFNTWVEIRKEPIETGNRPGDVYNQSHLSIGEAKAALLSNGWVNVRGKMWRRPGKKDGISATFGKVAEGVFYCFSSNAYPFESERAYTPFQIVTLLCYGGDFSAFAKYLSESTSVSEPASQQMPAITLLQKARVDLSHPVPPPPIALNIKEWRGATIDYIRLFTQGNFSAITGKAKAKKTFFLNMIAAALLSSRETEAKFRQTLPANQRKIAYFDTEQGDFDVYNSASRIKALANIKNFEMYQLREFSVLERCQIIEEYLKNTPDCGFLIIDGIADLAKAINDEEEATRVGSLLMKWTKQHNCHISTVIHQNKMNDFATGHLGSYVMKKAEIVISITKDKGDKRYSVVSCDYSRGPDFDAFYFFINDKGLPELSDKKPNPAKDEQFNEKEYYEQETEEPPF